MNSRSPPSSATPFLVRHYVEVLTGVGVLFILQTGLVPFGFGDRPGEAGSTALFGQKITDFTLPDIISNLFLYVPIGLLFHWSIIRRLHNTIAALLLTIGAAAALSGGIEYVQAYIGLRFSSIIDFTCNVIGASLGALISLRCRMFVPGLIRAIVWEFQEQPHEAIIKAYVCVLVFVAAMPFSFSLDTHMFKKSLKTVTVVPFGAVTKARAEADEALAAESATDYARARWRELKCWSRWAVECAAFAVLAWLVYRLFTADYGFGRRAATALLWWVCGCLAIALSLLQLLLVTRAFDITDILFRVLGIAGGLIARARYAQYAEILSPTALAQTYRRLTVAASTAVLVYILYIGVIPLTIDISGGGPYRALASTDFLPFFAYFTTRFDLMMADVMEKFVSYAVLAALLATVWTRVRRLDTLARALTLGVAGIALATALELVQMYIPVRVPSLTDLILAGCGSVAGVLVQEKAVAFYRFACSKDALRPKARRRRATTIDDLAPADALIASLTDLHTEAPVERVPTPMPKS